ncbi:MAG: isoaspartyl peptidase/L-asparaginase family protein [Gammaproteobacteria bacterium]|nr:isoaspartyl peptidase/L-asparaginase family protein [Gammaproteobacteria bacterium]
MNNNYSLMIHGGAGTLDHVKEGKDAVRYLESIRIVLEHGRYVLSVGGSAMEAVEVCAVMLEDDPLFNAGCGSVLNENGKVEMDAAIMDGSDLSAGAVAGISNIANPVMLARLVLAKTEHVMLVGEGAMRFAEHCGMERVPDKYFLTKQRIQQYEAAKRKGQQLLDHDAAGQEQKLGTIGAVARDKQGNLAAATSTGGIINKKWGRVGDSPIVGAGVYADNVTCAVSATGYGEDFMRTVLAKRISDLIELKNLDANLAVKQGIEYLQNRVKGRGGVILIDREGRCASAFTTKKMIHGWIENGGETMHRF